MPIPLKHKGRYTQECKTSIALASSFAGITIEEARKSFYVISTNFFKQPYQLSAGDTVDLAFTIPCRKTIAIHKHDLAVVKEQDVALQIVESDAKNRTIYCDTTQRAHFKGDWPAFLVSIDQEFFALRSLPLAHETRETIVDMFLEELDRLSILTGRSAYDIWQKIDSLMTDAAAKNLEIEKEISRRLNSDHVPIHLLCNTHVCECFDKSCLICLNKMEGIKELNMKEIILCRLPDLKSFLHGKSVVQAAIEAFIKITEHSAKTAAIPDEFEKVLIENGRKRKFTAYKERRFGVLGKNTLFTRDTYATLSLSFT